MIVCISKVFSWSDLILSNKKDLSNKTHNKVFPRNKSLKRVGNSLIKYSLDYGKSKNTRTLPSSLLLPLLPLLSRTPLFIVSSPHSSFPLLSRPHFLLILVWNEMISLLWVLLLLRQYPKDKFPSDQETIISTFLSLFTLYSTLSCVPSSTLFPVPSSNYFMPCSF